MTRSINIVTIAAAFTLALPLAATAQSTNSNHTTKTAATAQQPSPIQVNVAEMKTEAKIVEMDKTNRMAVLRTPKGELIAVHVPKEVHNFDNVKVGDDLVIRYASAVAARIEPASKTGMREMVETSQTKTAKPGSLPGMEKENTVEILATIQSVDRKAGTVTLRGATRTVTFAVPADVDMAKLKVGDNVRAVFTDAMMIDVEAKHS